MSKLPVKYVPAVVNLMQGLQNHVNDKGYVIDCTFEQDAPLVYGSPGGACSANGGMTGDITFSLKVPATDKLREVVKAFQLELLRVQTNG
jgi:hypothetical protein